MTARDCRNQRQRRELLDNIRERLGNCTFADFMIDMIAGVRVGAYRLRSAFACRCLVAPNNGSRHKGNDQCELN